jgi:glycosyltransferase involved in cell wall biosynthesis
MKICVLGNNGSVHVQKWVQALSLQKGTQVHVITFDEGTHFPGVQYHFLKHYFNNKLDYFLNVIRVKRYCMEIKPEILHAHYATSYGFLGALSGVHPFVLTGWGADIFDSPDNVVMRGLLKYSFGKADAITVLSKITKRELKKLSAKPVDLVPFGVEIRRFKNVPASEPQTILHIGAIRTLSEKYGIEFLIRAFGNLCKKYDHIHLDLVGDGPLKASLVALVMNLGINTRVTFHGYINQHTEERRYMELLNSFAIFVIPSIIDSETFGVAAVEASSCSIPVVASDVGGLPEVIEDQVTGILVPPKDVARLSKALDDLISSPEKRLSMGINGRKKVEQEYNWEENVNRMLAIYERVQLSSNKQ